MIRALFLVLMSLVLYTQVLGQAPPSAAEIVRSTLKALENAESVEYEVRRAEGYSNDAGTKFRGHTTVLATRRPFRFTARLQGEDQAVRALAVSDGKITRASYDGKMIETDTFALRYPTEKIMLVTNYPNFDVAGTWRILLDPEFLKAGLAESSIFFVTQDDIEGDLCNVVLRVHHSAVFGGQTSYYWISAKSGLPRAVQRFDIFRGTSRLWSKFIISNIRLNPKLSPEVFDYRPTAADSSSTPASKIDAVSPPTAISPVGSQLPELEVRDLNYQLHKLSDFKGKPTIITLWGTWCGPCIAEMPVLQKLQNTYKGSLQILAIAVKDSRVKILDFVKKNSRYKFTFLTDQDLQDEQSRLFDYFSINKSIPVGVFVNAEGKIVDHWSGFDKEEEFVQRIQQLMKQ